MRALVVTRHGGPEVLAVQDRAAPELGENDLLVAATAAGVNFVDVYQRRGVYPTHPPYVLGSEGAGQILAVGSAVGGFSVGDIVAWAQAPGSAAEQVVVPAAVAAIVPAGVAAETAAAALLQGMTAQYLTDATYPVQPGDWALVHAGAGGVGQLLVQLIRARGGHVIATVSTEAKADKVRALGADHVVNYAEIEDLAVAVRDLTGGTGVSVVYDGVGKQTFDASLASLKPRGVLALFGAASGPVPPLDPQRLNAAGSVYLTRPTMGSYLLTPEEFAYRSGAVLTAIADGQLKIEIGGRYPLDEAAQAFEDLENRRTTGKLLLIV